MKSVDLREIKKKLSSGADATYYGKRIAFIDYKSLTLGGDIKVRLEGKSNTTTIDVSEIKFQE